MDIVEARIAKVLTSLNPEKQAVEEAEEEDCQPAEEPRKKGKFRLDRRTMRSSSPPTPAATCTARRRKSMPAGTLSAEQEDQERPDGVDGGLMPHTRLVMKSDWLLFLFEQWYASPESVQGASTDAEMERAIPPKSPANQHLKDIQAEMERLKQSFAFSLRKRMRDAEKEGRDLLEGIRRNSEETIFANRACWMTCSKTLHPSIQRDASVLCL